MSLRKCFSRSAQLLAYVTCPDESRPSLDDCYKNVVQIQAKTHRMTAQPSADVLFISDFLEMRPDGFKNYADLANFLSLADNAFPRDDKKREEYPSAFQILQSARGFTRAYQGLPSLTQGFMNASLALQKTIIVRHIEDKAVEFTPLL